MKSITTDKLTRSALLTLGGTILLSASFSIAGKGGNGNGGGGNGGGGSPGTPTYVARIDFNDDAGYGIISDGRQACDDQTDPLAPWDYWDSLDTFLVEGGCDLAARADVSGGGRLIFGTAKADRWAQLDFTQPADPESDPNPSIDSNIYEEGDLTDPPIDPTPGIDNVNFLISMDKMFDPAATSHALGFTIRELNDGGDAPSGYSIRWEEELFIVDVAPDVRVLTTNLGAEDRSLASLYYRAPGAKGKNATVLVGTYYMPLEWTMRLVIPGS